VIILLSFLNNIDTITRCSLLTLEFQSSYPEYRYFLFLHGVNYDKNT